MTYMENAYALPVNRISKADGHSILAMVGSTNISVFATPD